MTLIVCPLRHVGALVAARRPSHVMTLLSPDAALPDGVGLPAARHLKLRFNDIAAPVDGLVPPDAAAVRAVAAFGAAWDARAPMLIHCSAGISRSTAAAYIVACLRAGPGHERDLALRLRARAPSATPNRLMIALADDLLGHGGRMAAAIHAIGRGADAFEGAPFDLEVGA